MAIGSAGRAFDWALTPYRDDWLMRYRRDRVAYAVVSRLFLLLNYVVGGIQVTAVATLLYGPQSGWRILRSFAIVGSCVGALDVVRLLLMRRR